MGSSEPDVLPGAESALHEARKALFCLNLVVTPDIAADVKARVEAAFAALAREIDAAVKAERERLLSYAHHDDSCNYWQRYHEDSEWRCTCGLAEIDGRCGPVVPPLPQTQEAERRECGFVHDGICVHPVLLRGTPPSVPSEELGHAFIPLQGPSDDDNQNCGICGDDSDAHTATVVNAAMGMPHSAPDEPLGAETEKLIADLCDEAVGPGARELRQFARAVRRPVERKMKSLFDQLSEARQALEAAAGLAEALKWMLPGADDCVCFEVNEEDVCDKGKARLATARAALDGWAKRGTPLRRDP